MPFSFKQKLFHYEGTRAVLVKTLCKWTYKIEMKRDDWNEESWKGEGEETNQDPSQELRYFAFFFSNPDVWNKFFFQVFSIWCLMTNATACNLGCSNYISKVSRSKSPGGEPALDAKQEQTVASPLIPTSVHRHTHPRPRRHQETAFRLLKCSDNGLEWR